MANYVRNRSTNLKISVEIEKIRPILRELFLIGDVVFISKEFSQFSGFSNMEEAVKGFIGLVKPGYVSFPPPF